jgi:SpoVK/Ycf46/Vps4 family AAA+-type ATPase
MDRDSQQKVSLMSTNDNMTQLNARFIDLLISRWEYVLDLRTHLAYRSPDAEDKGEVAYWENEIGKVLEAMLACREQVKSLNETLPFDQLIATYDLSPLEAEILALALVPQLELSFRQRIARFNNNILYDFVDVDLALTLLFPSRVERLQARALFSTHSPLIAHGLLRLEWPKETKGAGVLGQELRPPERLSDFILGRRSLDASLSAVADMSDPGVRLSDVAIPGEAFEELTSFMNFFERSQGEARVGSGGPYPDGGGMAISFVGPPGTGKSMLSEAIAGELKRPLIVVDSSRLTGDTDKSHALTEKIFAEAQVQGAVLLFDRCEPLFAKGNARLPILYSQMDRFGGLVILTLSKADDLDSGLERHITWQLTLEIPEVEQRKLIWKTHLPTSIALADDVDVEDLGTRFEITGGQIRNACILAETRALALKDAQASIDLEMLKSAAYAQLRADMTEYAVRSKVNLTLKDLVLPEKELGLIHEVLEACQNRVYVMSKWGFGKRLVTGKGICCLLKGEPGTGKTLCAELLAAELGMKLYQISIPKIVSKFIGETEKNIAKIFSTARANHSMLLFDEADSLFTKRVSVENAIDRFSNMETNMLLQEIERFEGIVILTTNLDKNIDDAFSRRIQFKIDFPFPTPENRAIIWRSLVPKECPIADDIDFDDLGEAFELSGGYIKNAVVRAAYRAAARQGEISYEDIEFAAEQECKSAGKLFRSARAQDDW